MAARSRTTKPANTTTSTVASTPRRPTKAQKPNPKNAFEFGPTFDYSDDISDKLSDLAAAGIEHVYNAYTDEFHATYHKFNQLQAIINKISHNISLISAHRDVSDAQQVPAKPSTTRPITKPASPKPPTPIKSSHTENDVMYVDEQDEEINVDEDVDNSVQEQLDNTENNDTDEELLEDEQERSLAENELYEEAEEEELEVELDPEPEQPKQKPTTKNATKPATNTVKPATRAPVKTTVPVKPTTPSKSVAPVKTPVKAPATPRKAVVPTKKAVVKAK